MIEEKPLGMRIGFIFTYVISTIESVTWWFVQEGSFGGFRMSCDVYGINGSLTMLIVPPPLSLSARQRSVVIER